MIIHFPTTEWQISVMQNLVRSAWFKISCTSSWNFPQGATASFAPLSLENVPSAGSCQCLNSFSSGKFLIKQTNKLRLLEMGHKITEKWSFIHSVSSICGHFYMWKIQMTVSLSVTLKPYIINSPLRFCWNSRNKVLPSFELVSS